jgi:LDH2 family malate/lactate/ureidoglycolate dehydrogenase
MVELLAGPLVGAAVADKLEAKNWGNLVLAVDPELLGDRDAIRARTQVRGLMGRVGCVAAAVPMGGM